MQCCDCGGLRITSGSRFSISTTGALGIEFKSLGFRAGISQGVIFLAQDAWVLTLSQVYIWGTKVVLR